MPRIRNELDISKKSEMIYGLIDEIKSNGVMIIVTPNGQRITAYNDTPDYLSQGDSVTVCQRHPATVVGKCRLGKTATIHRF